MPIGTAAGIRKTIKNFNDKPFLLVNADIWTNYLFIELRRKKMESCLANIVLSPRPSYHDGDFNIENDKLLKGKDFTYTGIGLYRPELFLNYPDKELGTILYAEKNIKAEVYNGLWDDVGTPERLNMLRKSISL